MALELVIRSRERDIGGFSVRRLLPYAAHRMVGPFVFFDHMGPADFAPGQGMDVRPHPHIHLATVTYLFEGKIQHRDSLGSDQWIEPGAINWMTAGHGIVHSERTPEPLRRAGGRLEGIQLWVALPAESENVAPSFAHHPAATLPELTLAGVKLRILLGEAFGRRSPVKTHSELFYAEALMPAGSRLQLPAAPSLEAALYVAQGKVRAEREELERFALGVGKKSEGILIEALEPSRLMLLGGRSVGPRHMFWNFISSAEENIEQAKKDWGARGPGGAGSRFPRVPGDEREFIPLPPG
jgi:redox-sensitive bicupin YhaK (pirin superfamily)